MYCSSLPLYYQLVIDSDEGEVDTGDAGELWGDAWLGSPIRQLLEVALAADCVPTT